MQSMYYLELDVLHRLIHSNNTSSEVHSFPFDGLSSSKLPVCVWF